jgi:hypothetical protein
MMHTAPRTALDLIHELWAERSHTCCPYVRHSERGCWCGSPTLSGIADRYAPCDTASLQLWCLVEGHYTRCLFYPAGDAG